MDTVRQIVEALLGGVDPDTAARLHAGQPVDDDRVGEAVRPLLARAAAQPPRPRGDCEEEELELLDGARIRQSDSL